MCTYIANSAPVEGAGKGAEGWFRLGRATVGYDHPAHARAEHAILLDFAGRDGDPGERVAVELDLDSGRALRDQLDATIRAAEASGV